MFEESSELDAQAFYALYAYYMDKSFSWLPFKTDRRVEYLAVVDSAASVSKQFWPLFLTSLAWMYYDKGDYNAGLRILKVGFGKAPELKDVGNGHKVACHRVAELNDLSET